MRAEGKRYVPRAADGQDIIIHSVIHMIQGDKCSHLSYWPIKGFDAGE
jgi:hypothetical protein